MIVLTAILTLALNVPFIKEKLKKFKIQTIKDDLTLEVVFSYKKKQKFNRAHFLKNVNLKKKSTLENQISFFIIFCVTSFYSFIQYSK